MVDKIQIRTINHVAIPVRDRQEAFKFYRDLLGLEVIPSMVDPENIVWMRCDDGTMVHLIEPREGQELGSPHTAYEVEDLDAAFEAVSDSEYPVDPSIGDRHDGQRYFFTSDPDGNRVEFATRSGIKPSSRVVDDLGYTREA